jgi:hypothetical protein
MRTHVPNVTPTESTVTGPREDRHQTGIVLAQWADPKYPPQKPLREATSIKGSE